MTYLSKRHFGTMGVLADSGIRTDELGLLNQGTLRSLLRRGYLSVTNDVWRLNDAGLEAYHSYTEAEASMRSEETVRLCHGAVSEQVATILRLVRMKSRRAG